jgi:large subunit ribosomal protein L40e
MPKQKIPVVTNRLYNRVYICMKCNAKLRSDVARVKAKKVKCRKCGYKGLRLKSKERKV